MIEFPLKNKTDFSCPKCQGKHYEIQETLFGGSNLLVKCRCNQCSIQFYHTPFIGHAISFPVSFDEEGNNFKCSNGAKIWFGEPLFKAFFKQERVSVQFGKKIFKNSDDVILLNCLDSCYGHVFYRLMNIERHLKENPDLGLVVIIPKNFVWLVPHGISEIWYVNAPLGLFKNWIGNMNEFVGEELKRFTTVYLSKTYPYLDTSNINLEHFVKQNRFNLSEFETLTLQISFVLREDRFWIGSRIESQLYLLLKKVNLIDTFKWYFIRRQNGLINKTAKALKKRLKDVRLVATGLGRTGNLNSTIIDLRVDGLIDEHIEINWCTEYQKSHLVIGVHGSNMLIPTSLAAGFIEILPDFKIDNIIQDISLNHKSRYNLFLGRHLPESVGYKLVVKHAISMIKHFSSLYHYAEKDKRE
ncbi:hypothetical protein QQ008_18460 [Fulvivirgaceae bacterium BMA10]|uniref:Glycosyltransferase n=1 Tax=Splendidivirga corallicola TaxID=3051826 RepID=A0ABT8KRI3_9BACT|nr:hypothetical protein [Fulvivirgaceae bacterium BMA10]